jgi:pheromone shutdown protein TraB
MTDIILVPTSHIAEESMKLVEAVIRKEKPECVAVELDMNRFIAMEHGEASPWQALRQLGPWTFLVMKKAQSWLGKKMGIMPGSEMLRAIRVAEHRGVHVEFIDQDLRITMERMKKISWREKAKLIFFLFRGLGIDRIASGPDKKQVKVDLRKTPSKELVQDILKVMKKEFPGFYSVLVTERNNYMARRLLMLSGVFNRIVAVTGAAHTPGLQSLLDRKRI